MPKIIELSGIVGYDITAKNLKNRLPKDGEKAVLKIDSVGGSVFEGNRLYNTINDHLNKFPGSLTGELGAIAASAASYFPMALGAENIKVRNNTTFMGHKAWTFAIGNADDMKAEAEILDGFDNIIAKVYSKVTGKPVEESLEDMKNEFWLIGGQSVVDAGFASGIIDDDESTEGEEPENITDKNEILALMKEAKNKIREVENSEDLNKWAARIHETLNSTDVEDDGQRLLFNVKKKDGVMKNTKNHSTEKKYKNGENLGSFLNRRIDELADGDDDKRSDIISDMANAAGISESTVRQILSGDINCPPRNRLEAFSDVLSISINSIIEAAEDDGCVYDSAGNLIGCPAINNSDKTVSAVKNNLRGDKMNLVDLLKANPEAKAEHEKLIETADTERVENAVKDERARTEEFLNLSGGKVTPDIVAAIKNGDSIGDFAVNEIKNRNKEIEDKNTADSNLGKLGADNQLPIDKENKEEKKTKTENVLDSVLDKMTGKKSDKGDK